MTYDYYNDWKTYGHDDLCRGENDVIYRASCTMLAMQGIPPNKDTIGNFWIEIDGKELVEITEDQDDYWNCSFCNKTFNMVEITEDQDDDWKTSLFRYIGLSFFQPSKKTERGPKTERNANELPY